ncbi:MAG: ATP-binding protein (plasmid) [Candidatus Algichlamydia australiensis]|nr:ATP-binding protein [Chlamydiales bacterium]
MKKRSPKVREIPEKIIGREREQELLNDLIRSKKSEFIAIYGRRRIGKTYLIKNFMSSVSGTFFHVTGIQKGTSKDQLEEFAKQIGKTFYNGPSIIPSKRWIDAFEKLTEAIDEMPKNKTIILFFDELPWMATPRSRLLTALELYWNRYWVFDKRIKLIICGSATSWIIENIINNEGGLHNRVTRSIQLKPFSLNEAKKYLKEKKIHLNNCQILDLYMVLGGIPLYWSFVRKGLSSSQCIDELCFRDDGPLIKEFDRLFESLFEDPKPYVDLIRIIAKKRYGIGQNELIKVSKLPDGGNTVRRLMQLEEAGFIMGLVPYGHKDKGKYYVIDDEYSLFYLSWIEPNIKTIYKKIQTAGYWKSQSKLSSWKSWSGYAFESVCYKHIDHIRKAFLIDPGATVGTWRYAPRVKEKSEGAQIDLLFDRLDGVITLCEIKSSDKLYAIDKLYAKSLLRKMDVFRKQTRTKKQLFFSMVTTHGLKPTIYSEELISVEATLEDLFLDRNYV